MVDNSLIFRIKSFLCNRKQRVKINGFFSDWVDVISGIRQGTILGPILFIIYINERSQDASVRAVVVDFKKSTNYRENGGRQRINTFAKKQEELSRGQTSTVIAFSLSD